ncbi:MAG: hypothetical protein HLUCCO16_06745 [Phormidium sp. OSCR]|nr:MAG: hypothetical protein HLUCCO16_06745 [Phormidium sp. OSCR]
MRRYRPSRRAKECSFVLVVPGAFPSGSSIPILKDAPHLQALSILSNDLQYMNPIAHLRLQHMDAEQFMLYSPRESSDVISI